MEKDVNTVKLEKVVEVPQEEISKWNNLINSDSHLDYDELGILEESIAWYRTAEFDDGFEMDIKVCSNRREDGDLWSEAVLFDENGCQYGYTVVSYGVDGKWELEWLDRKTNTRHIYCATVVGV